MTVQRALPILTERWEDRATFNPVIEKGRNVFRLTGRSAARRSPPVWLRKGFSVQPYGQLMVCLPTHHLQTNLCKYWPAIWLNRLLYLSRSISRADEI